MQQKHHDTIKTFSTVIQTILLIIGMVIGVREFVLKDRAAEGRKKETTRQFMDESWHLHEEVLNDIRQLNALLEADRPKSKHLRGIKDKESKILNFYLKLESCIEADLCDEHTATKLFCSAAEEEATRYFEYLFRYDSTFGYVGKADGIAASSVDLAIYRFVRRCPTEHVIAVQEPTELIEFKARLSPYTRNQALNSPK